MNELGYSILSEEIVGRKETALSDTGGNSETDAIIDRCERDSQRICVKCGKPATRISKGWICPYCDDCIGDAASVVIE